MPFLDDRTPYALGSDTSLQAARSLTKRRKGDDAVRIVRFIRDRAEAGATCDECEAALDMPHTSCSARIYDLVAGEVLIRTKLRRPTRAGRAASVLVVNAAKLGKEVAQ